MVLTKNSICNFGWKARDFALKAWMEKPIHSTTATTKSKSCRARPTSG